MKVLIIGGTGLISTAILEQLVHRGDSVTLFNRGFSLLRGPEPDQIIHGDRNDRQALQKALAQGPYDAVIDMVAFSPDQTKMLLEALPGKARQLVTCSTVCVYGGPMTKVPAQDDEPHRPVGDYGRNKSAIEAALMEADGKNGLRCTVIRPSFTTGEGATASGLLFDDSTVSRLRQGLPVVIMDDGKAAWAIAHVSDVASAFVGALGNDQAYGQAFHATSDEHADWNGVFSALAEAAGALSPCFAHIPSQWLYDQAPRRAVGIQYIYKYPSIFDNRKARQALGFKTTVSLKETFARQIKWMEANDKLKPVTETRVQDELAEAYAHGRPVRSGVFEDCNPWGNMERG
jgi:nucleoside-diphosphate-sugar epimerase